MMLAASLLDDPSSSIEDVYGFKLDWNGPLERLQGIVMGRKR